MSKTGVRFEADIAKVLISPTSSIFDAIESLNSSALQITFAEDDAGRVVGSVTDGDIRRALLAGYNLNSTIDNVMRRDFKALPDTASRDMTLRAMNRFQLRRIPLLDADGRLTKLGLIDEFSTPARLNNPVFIMAGGEGRRLRPLTKSCPKPMLKIGGKPLLEIIIEQCIDAGFREFYISVNYLKEQIISYFGSGESWGVSIQYIEESKPLGTVGALSLIESIPASNLLVLNGDVLTKVNFEELLKFHESSEAQATLCVREHVVQIPFGVIEMNGTTVSSLEEKPNLTKYVSAGIYVVSPALLQHIPHHTFFDMPQLINRAISKDLQVSAFPIHEYWLDVGHPEALAQANGDWF
jgi:dTDP-glucose pyrophosphorylase